MKNFINNLKFPKIFYINIFLLIFILASKIFIQISIGYTSLFLNIIIQLIILNILYITCFKFLKNSKLVAFLKYFILVFSVITLFDSFVFVNQINILLKNNDYKNEKIIHHTATDLGNRFETGKDSNGVHLGYVVNRNKLVQIEKSTDFKEWTKEK